MASKFLSLVTALEHNAIDFRTRAGMNDRRQGEEAGSRFVLRRFPSTGDHGILCLLSKSLRSSANVSHELAMPKRLL